MKQISLLKSAVTLCLALSISLGAFAAGVKRFSVTYSTGANYTPLSANAALVPFPLDWDDEVSDAIAMPFTFKYQNTTVDSFFIETYGNVFFNQYDDQIGMGSVSGINLDYESKNRGKIYYETVGTVGNRILKIEYRNVGRWADTTNNDTLNFQIWLYEQNNLIEYRAGFNNVPPTEFALDTTDMNLGKDAVFAGLRSNLGDSIAIDPMNMSLHATKFLNGAFSDTSISVLDLYLSGDFGPLLYGVYPANGSIIRFIPHGVNVGINKIDFDMATVYPNPAPNGLVTVQFKEPLKAEAKIVVYNMTGQMVLSQSAKGNTATLDLSHLPAGNYVGKIFNGNRTGAFEIVR